MFDTSGPLLPFPLEARLTHRREASSPCMMHLTSHKIQLGICLDARERGGGGAEVGAGAGSVVCFLLLPLCIQGPKVIS